MRVAADWLCWVARFWAALFSVDASGSSRARLSAAGLTIVNREDEDRSA